MKNSFRPKRVFPWKATVGFAFLAVLWHLPLLLSSSLKPSRESFVRRDSETPYIVLQTVSDLLLMSQMNWMDPTVYLLPSDHSFSSFLRKAGAASKIFVDDSPPPLLKQSSVTNRREGVLTSIEALTMMEAVLEEAANQVDPSPSSGSELPVEGSAWRVTGAIAERTPSNSSALPMMVHSSPLAPTVLRAGVTPRGDVQYALLEESSGYAKADEAAVRFAKGISFASKESDTEDLRNDLSWRFVKILWRVDRPIVKGQE